ncbi:hypothetical protein TBLA_0B07070 [Henningerozyma blattae CBS 6284]|uniref:Homeobox domain-containing protein n=1 Tax=Henningerozyma blattae (strain ATCC 34711 / CBS 6284 / DSM 70876 / NBRC 10599 / NRRL Y-10934 / UCD 77-7) TaxID=1071380 RepID=I2GZH4_HENB6|nr:hypothetical protein TBLA_0B07070 [Tetrapisispora blattae CBS 6284]CCH59526.1 hypothetical protein TBLA_0B07070 [Tetrapisispora blattae CBS 6284]
MKTDDLDTYNHQENQISLMSGSSFTGEPNFDGIFGSDFNLLDTTNIQDSHTSLHETQQPNIHEQQQQHESQNSIQNTSQQHQQRPIQDQNNTPTSTTQVSGGGGPSTTSNPGASSSQDQSVNTNTHRQKRTRATGEALDLLKQEFKLNPNPNSKRRKMLSESTGLPEKNVRIWFQNRRAKVRKSEQSIGISNIHQSGTVASVTPNTASASGAPTTATSPPIIQQNILTYFDRIQPSCNKSYYFIDVCSITVGTWNRMKSGALTNDNLPTIRNLSNLSPFSINNLMSNTTDLMVLISNKNLEINYFFSAMANNTKILFRVFFPISSIINSSLISESSSTSSSSASSNSNSNNNTENEPIKFGELKLNLSKSPNFAVYFLSNSNDLTANQWSICDDFSEDKQVSEAHLNGTNIPHVLKGLQSSLTYMNSLVLKHNTSATTNNYTTNIKDNSLNLQESTNHSSTNNNNNNTNTNSTATANNFLDMHQGFFDFNQNSTGLTPQSSNHYESTTKTSAQNSNQNSNQNSSLHASIQSTSNQSPINNYHTTTNSSSHTTPSNHLQMQIHNHSTSNNNNFNQMQTQPQFQHQMQMQNQMQTQIQNQTHQQNNLYNANASLSLNNVQSIHDLHIPNTPDFFQSNTELNDTSKWL